MKYLEQEISKPKIVGYGTLFIQNVAIMMFGLECIHDEEWKNMCPWYYWVKKAYACFAKINYGSFCNKAQSALACMLL